MSVSSLNDERLRLNEVKHCALLMSSDTQTNLLPEPDSAALSHSQELLGLLQQQMQTGPVSFAEYMRTVLYQPGLGYYMSGTEKFGARGDFTTAPEVSDLFGHCIAAQCAEVFASVGNQVLELGAGSGRLCGSVLTALSESPPEQYFILEPSADLQMRQRHWLKETLDEGLYERVVWLSELPTQFNGVCIANEVMDALPVERFCKTENGLLQVCVGFDNGRLHTTEKDAPVELQQHVHKIETALAVELIEGYRSEACLLLAPWIRSLASCMEKGVLLLSDYGYPRKEFYMPERNNGTLGCYFQHHFHDDPLLYPGLQDITAHVDFTQLVEAASEAGLGLLGYTSQASFLLSSGITELAATRMQNCVSQQQQIELANEIKKLTLPGEMGERFQFMALGKNFSEPLSGFAAQDLSHRL